VDLKQFILLPALARKKYKLLLKNQEAMEEASEKSEYNHLLEGKDKKTGIIACGLAYNYLKENLSTQDGHYWILKISQYPLPGSMIRKLAGEVDEILVLEEGYPVVEEMLRGFFNEPFKIKGRMD
ncbi:MAG: indolepyruvate ferredoxin oxidoreductase, partial [Bacteroidales bacterium]